MDPTVIAALVGALFGSLLTLITNRVQKTYELRLALRGKVLEKRMASHEKIIGLANSMIQMVILHYESASGEVRTMYNDENEIVRAPSAFGSKVVFEEFQTEWAKANLENSQWLSIGLVRELYLFQDYLVNLGQFLESLDDTRLPIVGSILRQDFIDFSASIKKLAYKYFYSDLEKLSLEEGDEWHKYEKQVTIKRLEGTALFMKADQLMNIARLQ